MFKVGDIVVALVDVEFMDGTEHVLDMEYEVTVETEAYFNVNKLDYRLRG